MNQQLIPPSGDSIFVTAREAAALLGVSVPTFIRNFAYPPANAMGQRVWFRDEVMRERDRLRMGCNSRTTP